MVTTTASRADEIVSVARRRLADSNGKASQLPAMIQRVTEEFRQRDAQTNMSDARHIDNFEMPNNMDAYIDRVLQMSGMMDAPKAGVPTPTPRPTNDTSEYAAPVGEVERGGPLPDAAPNPANEEAPDDASLMKIFGALAAAGGVAWAVNELAKRYGNQVAARVAAASPEVNSDARTAVDESIDAVDGTNTKQPRLGEPVQQIEGPRAALPAPEAATNVDASIQAIEGPTTSNSYSQEDIDRVFQDRVEGRAGSQAMPGPNRFARDTPLPDDVPAEVIEQATRRAQSGDIRGAVALLRENGIELDDNLLRQLVEGSNAFKSLQQRIGSVVDDAAGASVRRAVRP